VILRLAVLVQYRRVTDRRTDGHATTVYTALAWRRAVKCRRKDTHLTSLVFLFLAVLPVFLGYLPPLASYKFLALVLFSVLFLSVQLLLTVWHSLPESIRSSDTII